MHKTLGEGWKRRHWLQAMSGAAAGVALFGCAPPPPPLRLGSIVFAGYEPVFMARELGWLDPNLVRLVELYSNTDALRALGAGQIEAAQLTLDEFLSGRAGGVDLRVIAVLDESLGADAVIARPGLRDPNSPAGMRIAVEDGAVGAVMLSAFLKAHDLPPSAVQTVSMALGHNLEHFREGDADLFVTAEPWASQLEALGGVRVFDSTAIPGRIVDVMVARADVLERHAPALQALVAAHFRGVDLVRQQPQRAAELMRARLQLSTSELLAALKGLHQPDAAASRQMLQTEEELLRHIKTLEEVMVQDGLLKSASPHDTLFDTRFHPSHP